MPTLHIYTSWTLCVSPATIFHRPMERRQDTAYAVHYQWLTRCKPMKQESTLDSARQRELVAALADPSRYPHPVESVEHLETHISHILLAGDYAYKIKKPLNLGFLDFTSLSRRNFYCNEELRLNRRLAPDLYLACIAICGSAADPVLGGEPDKAIEYAVKMRRFPQSALLDKQLADEVLQRRHADALARQLADFHGAIAHAAAASPFGSPERILQPALDNFTQTRPLLNGAEFLEQLSLLEEWTRLAYQRLRNHLAARKADGFIRECHGDLHLGNMIRQDDRIAIFDCIEFNDDFRWIDVMSDLAFLTMDLCRRQASELAWRLLNVYLEFSGDYAGLAVLPFYQVYRAMVRAKIAAIRRHQPDLDASQRQAVRDECLAYLNLAHSFTRGQAPFLLITHGVSGSGKSYFTNQLLETLGAIRLRSDVERKRLFGLGPLDASDSALDQGLYTPEASLRTYQQLRMLAGDILAAGYPVLVDATFLEQERRRVFQDLANQRGVPFVLLACTADPETLRARVRQRLAQGGDAAEADIAVLAQQLARYKPPAAEERPLFSDACANGEALRQAILGRVSRPAS